MCCLPGSLVNNSLKPFRPTKRICLRTQALAKAMSNLSPIQRRAVELTKLHEMALKKASAATGTSIGALKVSTHRGLLVLRKALGTTN